jgi:hypothetical protein
MRLVGPTLVAMTNAAEEVTTIFRAFSEFLPDLSRAANVRCEAHPSL